MVDVLNETTIDSIDYSISEVAGERQRIGGDAEWRNNGAHNIHGVMQKPPAIVFALVMVFWYTGITHAKDKIHALYIPLADHYAAAIMAHVKYGPKMEKADYTIEMMKSWPSLRGKFMTGKADVAFIISPMAMDMSSKRIIL